MLVNHMLLSDILPKNSQRESLILLIYFISTEKEKKRAFPLHNM